MNATQMGLGIENGYVLLINVVGLQ